jgi:hypothetical protein
MRLFILLDFNPSLGDVVGFFAIVLVAFGQLVAMTIFSILALIKKKFGAALIIYWALFAITAFLMLTLDGSQTDGEREFRFTALYITMGYFFVYLAILIKEKTKNKNVTRPPKFKA